MGDQQRELHAKAEALGASTFTLSSEIGSRIFIEIKDRIRAAGMVRWGPAVIHPSLTPIYSQLILIFVYPVVK